MPDSGLKVGTFSPGLAVPVGKLTGKRGFPTGTDEGFCTSDDSMNHRYWHLYFDIKLINGKVLAVIF